MDDRGTSDRLLADMDEEAGRLRRVAHGFKLAGADELGRAAVLAAAAMTVALNALGDLANAQAAAARAARGNDDA